METIPGGEARPNRLSVFVDESGDLGYSGRSSKYFIICALATRDAVGVRRAMRKARLKALGKSLRSVPELKYSGSSQRIREIVLGTLARQEMEVWYVCLRKGDKTLESPAADAIYCHMAGYLIETIARTKNRSVFLVVDRFLPRKAIERFNEGLEERSATEAKRSGKLPVQLNVEHIDSQSEPCLQAADFVAGAIFARYERGDLELYEIIKPRITEEIIKWKW